VRASDAGRKIAFVLALALLLFTGVAGIRNGVDDWGEAGTLAQQSVTGGVFLYGILGLITAYGLIRRRRWSVATAIAWAVVITYVPGVAVMAYGGEGATLGSALAASTGSALIALGVIWTTNVMTRPHAVIQ
jgi:hypothetical protein